MVEVVLVLWLFLVVLVDVVDGDDDDAGGVVVCVVECRSSSDHVNSFFFHKFSP